MLSIIENLIYPAPPPFRPLPPPLPPRKPCGDVCNRQLQSPFLNTLPAEIRNEIYRYTFSVTAEERVFMKAHPLSLLLTCHKIYHEATNLAFHTHAFSVRKGLRRSFLSLRNATLHLSSEQVSAITALTYDIGKEYMMRGSEVGTALTNALLLLPNMKRFEIHVCNIIPERDVHDSPLLIGFRYNDVEKDSIEKYAPAWLDWRTLRPVANGEMHSWQKGQKWTIEWPQVKSPYFRESEGFTGQLGWMDYEAVGHERGVHMCPCNCGEVAWLSANLVQESGRVVYVDVCIYGPPAFPPTEEERFAHLEYRLRPGATRLPVKEGHRLKANEVTSTGEPTSFDYDITSFAYDADEKFWEGMRWRNRKWWQRYWDIAMRNQQKTYGDDDKDSDQENTECCQCPTARE